MCSCVAVSLAYNVTNFCSEWNWYNKNNTCRKKKGADRSQAEIEAHAAALTGLFSSWESPS